MTANNKSIFKSIYYFFIFARLASLLLVIYSLFWGWFIMFFLDLIDYTFALRSGITYKSYQNIDKLLDIVNRAYLVVVTYYYHLPFAWVIFALFAFRLIGDLAFYFTRKEISFLVFPNVLEFFFPLYLIYLYGFQGITNSNQAILILFLILSLLLKLIHEYFLHFRSWIDPISRKYVKNHPEHQRSLD